MNSDQLKESGRDSPDINSVLWTGLGMPRCPGYVSYDPKLGKIAARSILINGSFEVPENVFLCKWKRACHSPPSLANIAASEVMNTSRARHKIPPFLESSMMKKLTEIELYNRGLRVIEAARRHLYSALDLILADATAEDISEDRSRPLVYLVSQGQFDLFRRCLHTGVSWMHRFEDCLREAANCGHVKLMRYMIICVTLSGFVPRNEIIAILNRTLEHCAFYATTKCVPLLMSFGARLTVGLEWALCNSVRMCQTNTVKMLLQAGVDVHALNDAPLREASLIGCSDAGQLLILAGADINAREGWPLKAAIRRNHRAFAKILIDGNCDTRHLDPVDRARLSELVMEKIKRL